MFHLAPLSNGHMDTPGKFYFMSDFYLALFLPPGLLFQKLSQFCVSLDTMHAAMFTFSAHSSEYQKKETFFFDAPSKSMNFYDKMRIFNYRNDSFLQCSYFATKFEKVVVTLPFHDFCTKWTVVSLKHFPLIKLLLTVVFMILFKDKDILLLILNKRDSLTLIEWNI